MAQRTQHVGKSAVVIGGSMAGLLAARVLADHVEQVTVLERDAFPPPGHPRKGVPQGRHTHALLAKGREIPEAWFPGLTEELVAQGALLCDTTHQMRAFIEGGYHCRFASGLAGLVVGRSLLEGQVRARLFALPNVRAVEECDVLGLAASEDRTRITGVRVARRAPGVTEETLPADLVVDASGRGSRSPAWLEALGYPVPEEERVAVRVSYTTRLYRRRADHLAGDVAALVAATPETKRGGLMLAQEGDRWMVTLFGYLGEQAPIDEPGFRAFAESLPAPDIAGVIADAEPLGEAATYRFPASRRHRYERLARFPEGFLVVGDALCSFNPCYNQGMTAAALQARILDRCLASGDAPLAPRFFRLAAKAVDDPWRIAVGNDLRFPEVEGRRPPTLRFVNWYLGKLQIAARHDPVVTLAFARVFQLLAPPPSVLRPRLALRVLRGNLRSATPPRFAPITTPPRRRPPRPTARPASGLRGTQSGGPGMDGERPTPGLAP